MNHPYAGRSGLMTGEIISILGKPMAKVALSNECLGGESCYVSKGQVEQDEME